MTNQGGIARYTIAQSFDEDPNGYWVRYDDYLAALENKADIAESDLAMENMRLRNVLTKYMYESRLQSFEDREQFRREAREALGGAVEPGDGAVVMRPYPYTICNAKSPLECERQPDGHCAKCSPERTGESL